MHSSTGYQEKISTFLSTLSAQEAVESCRTCEVTPQPPLLDKPMGHSSATPYRTFLPGISPAFCPPLGTFKDLHIHLKLWGSELHRALQVWPHQCWVQQDNQLFWPTKMLWCFCCIPGCGLPSWLPAHTAGSYLGTVYQNTHLFSNNICSRSGRYTLMTHKLAASKCYNVGVSEVEMS